MTGRKVTVSAGRRPGLEECLEAWWRVADSPAGRILPEVPRGKPGDRSCLCDPFDLFCWRLVGEALSACRVRGVPPTLLSRLVAHVQCGGRCSTFSVHDVVQIDPEDARGFRSKPRAVTEMDRLGVDDAWIARGAYAKFRRVLQSTIDASEPFMGKG